jgi:ribonuclease HI
MRNHPQRNLACRYELEEHYVANTFTRVWQASMRNRLEFDTLVAALSYLKLSLQGTILDTLRAYAQPREVPLPNADSATISSEKQVFKDDYKSSDLWEIIKSLLHDDRERRLAYLLFHCGLKPREIVRYHSAEIGEVQEIIRLTRNIMERLIGLRD